MTALSSLVKHYHQSAIRAGTALAVGHVLSGNDEVREGAAQAGVHAHSTVGMFNYENLNYDA